MKQLLLIFGLYLMNNTLTAQTTIVSYGSLWKYRDNGSNQGTAWRSTSFNDASWAQGPAQLGYGDGDEATVVSYGSNANNKYITTYFRKTINITDATQFTSFTLNVKRDDGAVVYINGVERFRTNMPTGTISYTTKASSNASDNGNTPQTKTLSAGTLNTGNNVIAVEVHQRSRTSSDLSFDLELIGIGGDITAPVVSSFSPTDNTTDVSTTTNLVLTFNENIQKGAGNVLIKENGVTTQTINVSSADVTVSGNTATISPSDFTYNAAVNIEIDAGAFRDIANNNYAGINNATTWNFTVQSAPAGPQTFIAYGSSWKYLDNGSDQGTAWQNGSYNDAGWATGNAQLGYGDGDEATVVSYGPSSTNKYITTYFRKTITISDPSAFSSFTGNIKRDDGVIVYVNGVEVYRSNLPAGSITYTTLASTFASDDGATPQLFSISSSAFVSGSNVIAVEMHQNAATSTDLSFDLELTGTGGGADITPPVVSTYLPADNATGVSNITNLVLTFDENIQKGAGNVLIKENGVTTQTINVSSADVTVSGNTVTINPSDFTYTATVNIEIDPGAFKDIANNNYAGISDAVTWNFTVQSAPSGPQTFIAYGSSWKYLDNGSDQGTAWQSSSYNDAGWATGNAQLGYGDGDETTVVSYGPSSTNKYITTYFRKTITISDASAFSSFTGNVKRDDGVVVYVNGVEVYRSNLPTGSIAYTTLASTFASDDGATPQTFSISPSAFVSGNNVIAVEMHQNAATSTDLSFDLELIGNTGTGGAVLTRGPYLQMGNQSAVTLRWRTDIASDSKIEVGTVHGSYTLSASNPASTTEHEVRITGLATDTKYYYRFGSSSQILQNGTDNYFITAPAPNTTRKVRFAAFGDCGRNDNSFQTGSLNSYQTYVGSNPGEIMLLLGDNAYNGGLDAEYQSNFFNTYSSNILKNHIVFPSPGNHDYNQSASRQADHNIPYYSIFTMPTNAECGGVASGNEAYYSFDWGGVHFLSLDSYGKEDGGTTRLYDTLGAQVTWIKQDLAANTNKFTIAYWHHPPYTMGSHSSDNSTELINIRQNFIRILERYGVDIILCGHSHNYERSYLLKDYFGNEASFNAGTHAVSNSSAKYDGTTNSCTYQTAGGQVNHGTVYVVAGSAGADGGVQAGYPHNALPFSIDDGGMFYFEVEDNRLDAKFIRRDGVIADKFTIMKDVSKTNNPTINAGENIILTASWVGNYNWNTSATTRSITVNPATSTTYTVTDGVNCVTDVFNVTVNSNLLAGRTAQPVTAEIKENKLSVVPTLVKRGQPVRVSFNTGTDFAEILVMNVNGKTLLRKKSGTTVFIETGSFSSGTYIIKLTTKQKTVIQKIVVVE